MSTENQRRFDRRATHAFVLAITALTGCAAESTVIDAGERMCGPGFVRACECPNGSQGRQPCNADGTGYLACECVDAAVPDVAVVPDSPSLDCGRRANCDGVCVDLQTSRANCGACANACREDESCVSGRCQIACGSAQRLCGGRCVSREDTQNCGGCGNRCPTGASCQNDRCTLPSTPENTAARCSDGSDNDGDGLTDCADADCASQPTCTVDAGVASDPCMGLTVLGRCASPTQVEFCSVATGGEEPHIARFDCAAGERCVSSGIGAACELVASCREGSSQCSGATLQTCRGGRWVEMRCTTQCIDSAIGSACGPNLTLRSFSGRVVYEARSPNAGLTDWGPLSDRLAQGFMVISRRGTQVIDVATTSLGSSGGVFTIRVPSTVLADDELVVAALSVKRDGDVRYAVFDPGYAPSRVARDVNVTPSSPSLWSWSFALAGRASGETLRITADRGSGAARVYDYIRYVLNSTEEHFGEEISQPLAAWVGTGVEWSCGACQNRQPVEVLGLRFPQQTWLDGGSATEGYWSDAVTAHELGHYVMAAYGYPPGEGGPHFFGVPTHPGQAWSEGWATFHSSVVRNNTRYFDKQDGSGVSSFLWFDIEARRYSSTTWRRPAASAGLMQMIDENEVSAMLWSLRSSLAVGPYDFGVLLHALAAPRLTIPPFARGYRRRVWRDPANPSAFTTTSQSAPMLADYFDLLLCGDALTALQMDLVTTPSTYYPFPSRSPLCP